MEITRETIDAIIEVMNGELGLTFGGEDNFRSDYSGRGMYGKTCIGFDLNHASDAMYLGAAIAQVMGLEGALLVGRARQDSMGLGIIVYFPGVTLAAQDDNGGQCANCVTCDLELPVAELTWVKNRGWSCASHS